MNTRPAPRRWSTSPRSRDAGSATTRARRSTRAARSRSRGAFTIRASRASRSSKRAASTATWTTSIVRSTRPTRSLSDHGGFTRTTCVSRPGLRLIAPRSSPAPRGPRRGRDRAPDRRARSAPVTPASTITCKTSRSTSSTRGARRGNPARGARGRDRARSWELTIRSTPTRSTTPLTPSCSSAELAEANALNRDALTIWESRFGPDHAENAYALGAGQALLGQGKAIEAAGARAMNAPARRTGSIARRSATAATNKAALLPGESRPRPRERAVRASMDLHVLDPEALRGEAEARRSVADAKRGGTTGRRLRALTKDRGAASIMGRMETLEEFRGPRDRATGATRRRAAPGSSATSATLPAASPVSDRHRRRAGLSSC